MEPPSGVLLQLPEMSEKLAKFALQKLRNSGVEVILNRRVNNSLKFAMDLSHTGGVNSLTDNDRVCLIICAV